MKKYINRFILLSATALLTAACSENEWNDKLDGFESSKQPASEVVEYTLTPTDYSFIANKLASAKSLASANDASAALALVGSQGCFNAQIDPEDYLPLFLENPSFPYFALSNGSAVKVTYLTNAETDPVCAGVAAAKTYTVSNEDYKYIWESDNDYTEAFTPSKPAAKNIPTLLKVSAEFSDAKAGDYVMVNYKQAATDPVFTTEPTPDVPVFTPSSVLGSYALNDEITVNGIVMAVSTQGCVVSDAAGSIFAYQPAGYSNLKVGDQVVFTTTVASYNYGYQTPKNMELEVVGNQTVTYPTPKVFDGAELQSTIDNAVASGSLTPPVYGSFTGTVVVSGNYINLNVDGTTFQLSPYGVSNTLKAQFTDGATVNFEGYYVSISSKKYLNVIITKFGSTPVTSLSAVARAASADSRAVSLATTNKVGIYTFDGTKWTEATGIVALNHADYQAMGQKYDNLSGTSPESLLPIYLKTNYPYAQDGNQVYIAYNYYTGSETVIHCDKCVYNGSEWNIEFDGATSVTAQYVKKNGKWLYSPDVVVTIAYGRNIPESSAFYQPCVDWVLKHVPDGAEYVTSYGNNDYYTGASAYQNNVDLRPDKAREQYPAGYEGMTDDEIIEVMKKRFTEEVLPDVLRDLYPDVAPTAKGVQPYFTLNYYYYTGSATLPAQAVYQIVDKATFKFESATWSE